MAMRTAASEFLKEGSIHLSGVDEAILKNIEAVRGLSQITRTSLGPNGQNKFVINHLNKMFCTSDAGTIVTELDVEHPAAKLVAMVAKRQEEEVGDAMNLIVVLAGELLAKAEDLIRMGLHPPDIIDGYNAAWAHVPGILEDCVAHTVTDMTDTETLARAVRTAVAAKQYGYEDILAPVIAEASRLIMPANPKNFNVDNVRVCKIVGAGVHETKVVEGMIVQRGSENPITTIENAKIAIFTGSVDITKTDTKGTVFIENADQLRNFSMGEEKIMDDAIKAIADAGVNVIIAGGAYGDLALHFLTRHGIMALKVLSKFELRRIARLANAVPMVRVGPPTEREMGHIDHIDVKEIGSTKVTVLRQDASDSRVSTILIRGATPNLLDDIERAIDDGVNNIKQLARDGRMVAGAGACEIEIARRLAKLADETPGLNQYAIQRFGEALEVIPRTLAENAGHSAFEIISNLIASHEGGDIYKGVNVDEGTLLDARKEGILDTFSIKLNAIKLAVDVVTTVLRIDQIIMARAAGGPKPPGQMGPRDA